MGPDGESMKIQNDGPNVTPRTADSPGRIADPALAPANDAAFNGRGDQVTLSPAARLMQGIEQAAAHGPAIRQDVVDRMRALFDKGELASDPSALAECIIDDWTTNP